MERLQAKKLCFWYPKVVTQFWIFYQSHNLNKPLCLFIPLISRDAARRFLKKRLLTPGKWQLHVTPHASWLLLCKLVHCSLMIQFSGKSLRRIPRYGQPQNIGKGFQPVWPRTRPGACHKNRESSFSRVCLSHLTILFNDHLLIKYHMCSWEDTLRLHCIKLCVNQT